MVRRVQPALAEEAEPDPAQHRVEDAAVRQHRLPDEADHHGREHLRDEEDRSEH
jgi:hypothetical protein